MFFVLALTFSDVTAICELRVSTKFCSATCTFQTIIAAILCDQSVDLNRFDEGYLHDYRVQTWIAGLSNFVYMERGYRQLLDHLCQRFI